MREAPAFTSRCCQLFFCEVCRRPSYWRDKIYNFSLHSINPHVLKEMRCQSILQDTKSFGRLRRIASQRHFHRKRRLLHLSQTQVILVSDSAGQPHQWCSRSAYASCYPKRSTRLQNAGTYIASDKQLCEWASNNKPSDVVDKEPATPLTRSFCCSSKTSPSLAINASVSSFWFQ